MASITGPERSGGRGAGSSVSGTAYDLRQIPVTMSAHACWTLSTPLRLLPTCPPHHIDGHGGVPNWFWPRGAFTASHEGVFPCSSCSRIGMQGRHSSSRRPRWRLPYLGYVLMPMWLPLRGDWPSPIQRQRRDEEGDIAVPCSAKFRLSKYIPAQRKRSNAPGSGKVG